MLKLPKAVFFDWDGTLVDSFAFLHAAHNHTRKTLGREPFSLEVFAGYFGQPRETLYAHLYEGQVEDAKKHFEAFVLANHIEQLKPCEGAEDVLRWLQGHGIPCGIVTNKKRSLVEAEIGHYGWAQYFVSVVGAGEAEHDKPSHLPLRLAVERAELSLNPSDIWYVGDTENDLACGDGYGAHNIFIEDGRAYHEMEARFAISLHMPNCASFYDFLLQYEAKALKTN